MAELEVKMDEIKERIAGQLDFGGARTAETEFGTFYFTERNGKKIRVNIKSAHIDNGKLILEKIVPEGKNEMSYEDFLRGRK